MRFFCDGVTRQNRLVSSIRALERLFAERGKLRPGEQSLDRNSELGADVLGHALIVAGEDFDADATAFQRRDGRACACLGRIEECGVTGKHKILFVGHDHMGLGRRFVSPGDAEHAEAFLAERVELRVRARQRRRVKRLRVAFARLFVTIG